MTKKRKSKPAPRDLVSRGRQLYRGLAICLHLQQLRYGATLKELAKKLEAQCCQRTVRRDLEALEALGCIKMALRPDGKVVWSWIPVHVLKLKEDTEDGWDQSKYINKREDDQGRAEASAAG